MIDIRKKKPRVLLADDDAGFRHTLAKVLRRYDYDVRLAENGLVAKTIIDMAPQFDVIISDVQMPELDGVELFDHVRTRAETPVILMSGFTQKSDLPQASSKYGFLKKPFDSDTMVNLIDQLLGLDRREAPPPTDDAKSVHEAKYCPIHIDEFISSSKLHSDVFIKLPSGKSVKVAHRGEVISVERLRTYKDKKVEHLFVTFEDFKTYVDFTVRVSSSAMKSKDIKAVSKAKLLKHTSEILAERCFLGDLDPKVVKPATQMVEDSLELLAEDDEIIEVFLALQSHSDRLYAHSVAVSVFSAMVAKLNGWTSSSVLFKVCLAGFFHDIGYKEMSQELLSKKRIFRTPQDTKLLESHTARSRELILGLRSLPEDISVIAFQHHESPTGTGYPLRLSGSELHPLTRIISTVDRFVERIIPISEEEPQDPEHALDVIENLFFNDIDSVHFHALRSLFSDRTKK
jgi:HD-GYP domain-containing protein (c-di-GMP phosphodiesterase class II)/DNA-binding NarL/FixJ family response regulator